MGGGRFTLIDIDSKWVGGVWVFYFDRHTDRYIHTHISTPIPTPHASVRTRTPGWVVLDEKEVLVDKAFQRVRQRELSLSKGLCACTCVCVCILCVLIDRPHPVRKHPHAH